MSGKLMQVSRGYAVAVLIFGLAAATALRAGDTNKLPPGSPPLPDRIGPLRSLIPHGPPEAVPAGPPSPRLLGIRKVFVELLTGDTDAARFRDVLISALQNAHMFTITEKPENADTVLRGAAYDETYEDRFDSSDRLNARTFTGGSNNNKTTATGRAKAPIDISVGEDESTHIQERKHEAYASVRLVDKDGDVVWSTTKESGGAKFRGAGADVADKIVKQLIYDVERAKKAEATGR